MAEIEDKRGDGEKTEEEKRKELKPTTKAVITPVFNFFLSGQQFKTLEEEPTYALDYGEVPLTDESIKNRGGQGGKGYGGRGGYGGGYGGQFGDEGNGWEGDGPGETGEEIDSTNYENEGKTSSLKENNSQLKKNPGDRGKKASGGSGNKNKVKKSSPSKKLTKKKSQIPTSSELPEIIMEQRGDGVWVNVAKKR